MFSKFGIESLIALENDLISKSIADLLNQKDSFVQIEQNTIDAINKHLPHIAANVHHRTLLNLFYTFVINKYPSACSSAMTICFNTSSSKCREIPDIDIESIIDACEQLHISFLNSKFTFNIHKSLSRLKSKERLVELGAVYTKPLIAKEIVKDTLSRVDKPIEEVKILDFACGTGRFYENIISSFPSATSAILSNIYAIDIDIDALLITRLKALSYFSELSTETCEIISRHIINKDALRKNTSFFPDERYISQNDLEGLTEGGFDAIVSNPPYLVLKPNKSKTGASNTNKIQEQVSYFRSCGHYQYSIEGMLNLYKLSIERMLQMLKPGGILGVICPSTLFGDVSASKLRKHLLTKNQVYCIRFFAERIPLFENVNQATNIFILKKDGITSNISISENNESFEISLNLIEELFHENLEIPTIKSKEWDILRKLSSMKKLKHHKFIRNRRGELDLTLCKKYITCQKTPLRLVRGNMISDNGIKDINGEYVIEYFVTTRSKAYQEHDFNKKRLICQQVSNGGLKRRLKFVYCSDSDILGNSCNYISSDEETLAKLYLILNSSILNWRFKITSSNNHINNYELGELPIVDLSLVDSEFSFSSQNDLDEYIGSLYGLTSDEIKLVAL